MSQFLMPLIIFLIFVVVSAVKAPREYERLVVFRLGRIQALRGPGLCLVIPGIERFERVNLRLITLDVPPQDVITKDNVSIKVNAVIYYRVMDPEKAIIHVDNYAYATSQFAQTTLRSILGEVELDDILMDRETINDRLQVIIDHRTDPFGIKVSAVEIKHVDLPPEMQRAMARQAEAERERRAKIIAAEGEAQAADKLAEAARAIEAHPMAMQMRFLQTLTEVASENNSTTIFPIPIDLFEPFLAARRQQTEIPGKK